MHSDFFLIAHHEMEEEIYCFVIFMIAKYGQFYIIIGQTIASRGILFVPNENNKNYLNLHAERSLSLKKGNGHSLFVYLYGLSRCSSLGTLRCIYLSIYLLQ
jgi:hypothetical protein